MADPELTNQLLELLVTMKTILTSTSNSPAGIEQVRVIIGNHPQLAYGLIKTMVSLNIVDQDAFQTTLAASLNQQAPPPAPPPLIPTPQPVANHGVPPPNQFSQYPTQQQYGGPMQQQQTASYPPARAAYPLQPPQQQPPKPSRFGPPQAASQPPPPVIRQQPPAPSPYSALPPSRGPPSLPAAAMHLPPDQKEVVMRVLALTPAQIQALPPVERDTFMAIRQQLLGPGA
ncbi:hypothetical protein FRB93_011385 [Tulasnella sp. JGI-2019a]|nr:hypothetical protein FRB93_011385 [Tulasnella sp. JGI-2019a]